MDIGFAKPAKFVLLGNTNAEQQLFGISFAESHGCWGKKAGLVGSGGRRVVVAKNKLHSQK